MKQGGGTSVFGRQSWKRRWYGLCECMILCVHELVERCECMILCVHELVDRGKCMMLCVDACMRLLMHNVMCVYVVHASECMPAFVLRFTVVACVIYV